MPVPTVRLPSNDTVAAACVLLITTFAAFTVLWKSAPLLLVTVTVPMSVPTGPPTVTAPVALNATFDGVDPPTRFAPVIEPVPMVEPAKVSVSLSAMVMLPVETVPPLTASVVPSALSELVVTPPAVAFNVPVRLVAPNCRLPAVAVVVPAIVVAPPAVCVAPLANVVAPLRVTVPVSLNTVAPAPAMLLVVPRIDTRYPGVAPAATVMPVPTVRLPSNDTVAAACVLLITTFAAFTVLWKSAPLLLVTVTVPMSVPTGPPTVTAPVALNATFDGVDPPTRFAPVIEPVPMVEPAKVSVSLSAMVMLPVETVPPLTASVVPSALSELVVTPPAVAFNVPVRLVAPNCRLPAVAVVVPAIVVAPPAVCVAPLANVV